MRIVYRKIGGRASDIRYAADDYALAVGELETQGDKLPSVESLSDPKTQAELDADTAAALRRTTDDAERAAAKVDSAILALVNSTPVQLMTFARNNFPSLTLAEQNRIGLILNILAVAVRPHVR